MAKKAGSQEVKPREDKVAKDKLIYRAIVKQNDVPPESYDGQFTFIDGEKVITIKDGVEVDINFRQLSALTSAIAIDHFQKKMPDGTIKRITRERERYSVSILGARLPSGEEYKKPIPIPKVLISNDVVFEEIGAV